MARQMRLRRRPWLLLTTMILVAATATPAFAAKDTAPPTTLPAQLEGGSSAEGVTALSADCVGCYGAWGLWEYGNTIRALRGSYTSEFVTFIHVHWAFIKPDPDSCSNMYDGPFASNGVKEKWNTAQDQVKDGYYSQGGQHHWTNAGAHKWIDDGVTFTLGEDGSTDICKDFGW